MTSSLHGNNPGLAKCTKHDSKLDYFCAECVLFVCDQCKPNHQNHTLRSTINDNDVYTDACIKFVDSLVEGMKHVESYKQLIQGIVDASGDSIKKVDGWERDLLAFVKEKASLLRENLRKARANYEKILDELSVPQVLEKVEEELSKVPIVRKLRQENCEMLSQELAKTQQMVEQFNEYQTQLTMLYVPTVEQIIPSREGLDAAKSEINDAFDPDIREPSAGFKHRKLNQLAELDIDILYRFCRTDGRGKVIIHGYNTTDIHEVNLDNNQLEGKHTADVAIWSMVATTKDEYVAVNNNRDAIHLLDKQYHTISTEKCDPNNQIWTVDYLSRHRFVKLEVTKGAPHKAYISVMAVKNKKMVTEKTITIDVDNYSYHYMCVHNDKIHVSVCGYGSHNMYKVNIDNGTSTKHGLSHQNTRSIRPDADDNVIVSSIDNKIRVYDEHYTPHIVVDDVPGHAWDMMIRNGRIYATTWNNPYRLFTYM